ncbi:MAG TPA: DNA repair protein RecN [Candidatus Paenalcaligenes intestinipullorum]|uniref:DNA repair protein RecN n=1 Tax=Candidatus Paenalcaligenes intestinipullorum TaxID=2838718 RepID=A0A9D2U9B0_9BURK|nr:DNA repair protein RecN [Candidatus Paenalcaligenes intestinipullorum]
MLRSLHIHNFVIVDQAHIEFEAGFTVFSGETGAGKSILIDALSLILGARGDSKVIREGSDKADLSAVFDLSPEASQWLAAHDLDSQDSLILRRVLDAQGRSRGYINGAPATLGQLRELGDLLVDIHGQHAHQSLLQAAKQYELLDAQGGHLDLAQQVAQAWHQRTQAQQRLLEAQANASQISAEQEHLVWQLNELNDLHLGPQEWEQLNEEHGRLAHGQALLDGTSKALQLLDGEHHAAQRLLLSAAGELQSLLQHDASLQRLYDTVESAHIACSEAVSDLNRYMSDMELDPERLATLEARMAHIFSLARKYKVEPEALPMLQLELQSKLDALQAAIDLEGLQAQLDAAEKHYDQLAKQLSTARTQVGEQLSTQVSQAMQELSMEGGQFVVKLAPSKASAHGHEQVEFLVAGHAGVAPAPLSKVASGGELARISLALAVIASQAAQVPTLIFDEVDTGIGGAVAEIVGRLLRELGARHQVLCVTHLPQVAAQGQQHLQVSKQRQGAQTVSHIRELSPTERVDEIARMLGGVAITKTTREHAAEMLQHH